MLPIEVPYRYKTDIFGGTVCNPVLVVEVAIQSGYQPFEFLLDSGADCTIVPRGMAKLIGVTLPRIADASLAGIGPKSMAAYRSSLNLRIQQEEFVVECLITRSDTVPFLLGRVDFFDLFNVAFDNRNQIIILDKLR